MRAVQVWHFWMTPTPHITRSSAQSSERPELPAVCVLSSVMVQGDIMAETVEGESRNPAADAVAVAVYSVLVLLLMLAWTYVPA
jgi:hypothetical protein